MRRACRRIVGSYLRRRCELTSIARQQPGAALPLISAVCIPALHARDVIIAACSVLPSLQLHLLQLASKIRRLTYNYSKKFNCVANCYILCTFIATIPTLIQRFTENTNISVSASYGMHLLADVPQYRLYSKRSSKVTSENYLA